MGTLFRLLLAENRDIKFLRFFAKMIIDREGGGSRIFPELGKVLWCHMPNFRSLGQSLHIDNFCKNEGGGGEGGGAQIGPHKRSLGNKGRVE